MACRFITHLLKFSFESNMSSGSSDRSAVWNDRSQIFQLESESNGELPAMKHLNILQVLS